MESATFPSSDIPNTLSFSMELDLSSFTFLATLFLGLLGFILRRRSSWHGKSDSVIPLPPGPRQWPIIGNIHLFVRGYAQRTLRDLAGIYGPLILIRLGQVDFVVASSREAAEEIVKHQDLNFAFRPEMVFAKIMVYGGNADVAFAPYGGFWKQMRKIYAMELMSTKRVRSFFSVRQAGVFSMLDKIRTEGKNETPVALSEILLSTVNFIAIQSAFGVKAAHLQRRVLHLVKQIVSSVNGLAIEDMFPSLKFMDTLTGVRFKLERLHRQLDTLFDEMIEQHQADRANQSEITEENLLDVLLRLKEEGDLEFPLTSDVIKSVIFEIFIAGSESSSSVVEWAMAEMMKNPKVMEKAQQEVRRVLAGRTKIEESDMEEFHYLKLVMKESLRLHIPGPLLMPRVCKETCQVLGYRVPAGTRVLINAWAMARDKRYWGSDVEIFNPERFANNSVDYKGFNCEYLPFGSGRRVCPGMTFGLTSVETVLANLLLYFDWQLPNGMKPEELNMDENSGVTTSRKSPLFLLATPRIPLPTKEIEA